MENLLKLPFDIYQRYKLIAEIITQIRNKTCLKILDVGGYPGYIKKFLQNDEIIISDLKDNDIYKELIWIKADVRNLPFKNNSFDIVISSDMLEHIPKEFRKLTIDEMIRVSNNYVIIAAPFALEKKEIEIAECIINQFEQILHKKEHLFLIEHINTGLPNLNEFKNLLHQKGVTFIDFPNGYLYNWLFMMGIREYLSSLPATDNLNQTINYFYNLNFYKTDNREPAYRRIFLITKGKILPEINREILIPSSPIEKVNQELEEKFQTLNQIFEEKINLISEINRKREEEIKKEFQEEKNKMKIEIQVLKEITEKLKFANENLTSQVLSLNQTLNSLLQTKFFKFYNKINQIKKYFCDYFKIKKHKN